MKEILAKSRRDLRMTPGCQGHSDVIVHYLTLCMPDFLFYFFEKNNAFHIIMTSLNISLLEVLIVKSPLFKAIFTI